MIKGMGASSGIAIGKAFVLPAWEWNFADKLIDVNDLAFEFDKLYESIRFSKTELELIKQDIAELVGVEESGIFNAHMAILEDPIFLNEVQDSMRRHYKAAEVAVKETIDKFVGMFDLLDDEYMKERAADIRDVGNRLLKHLLGDYPDKLPVVDEPYILVVKELTPTQFSHLDPALVLGVVSMVGGITSHAAIMARAMGIPFVMGLEGKLESAIQTGDILIADGDSGNVIINPDQTVIAEHEEIKRQLLLRRHQLKSIIDVPVVTVEGTRIELKANISSIKELEQAIEWGACGVGLFRTEFIHMDRLEPPDEEEQFAIYQLAAEKLNGKELVIRALDIGADKLVSYIHLPEEENPALGYRSIRILLHREDIFLTQLRAILRASHYGNVKIMYPMISSIEELRGANQLLAQAKEELKQKGQRYNPNIEVGIMIEVPAAVTIADILAKEVQFFSIGTNDLIQYVLAVDRMNEKVAHLYNPYHPAIIRYLQETVRAAARHNIDISVCGELAGESLALPIWLGLGIHKLSMSVQSILPVKEQLLRSSEKVCMRLLKEALACSESTEIRALLETKQHITMDE